MKKESIKYFFLLVLLTGCLPSSVFGQKNCRQCIRDLYESMFHERSNSIKIEEEEYSSETLYMGEDEKKIMAFIAGSRQFAYGSLLDSIVVIGEGKKALYYRVSTEPPTYCILDIYDAKGLNLLGNNDYLCLPAVIRDRDGYVNICQQASGKSEVVGRIKRNQIFFYTPSMISNWYKVYLKYGGPCVGYIYKEKISSYENCSPGIRKKMEQLFCC